MNEVFRLNIASCVDGKGCKQYEQVVRNISNCLIIFQNLFRVVRCSVMQYYTIWYNIYSLIQNCDRMQCDPIKCNTTQCYKIQSDTIQCGTYSTIQCATIKYNMIQCDTMQSSTVLYKVIQYSEANSTVWH